MTNRERIIHTVLGRDIDRQPFFFFFGPWPETVERWKAEGMESDTGWREGFGFDAGIEMVSVNLGYSPAFTQEVLEEKADTRIVRDTFGIVQEVRRHGSSIPNYLDYPVKTAADWKDLQQRLDPHDPARFPADWQALTRQYNESEALIQIGSYPYGLFGTLRDMMGVETLLLSFYDQPELIHEMMGYLTDFWLALYEQVCRDVQVQAIHMWEDMSGRNGPLISPQMVRDFMLPQYRRMREFADAHGIPILSLDTDGDCSALLPLYQEAGINLVFPFEVAAGSDVVAYRQQFPELCLMGGIDKLEIAKGPAAIDRELDRIQPILQGPKYIPALDHLMHPQISWDDYQYFVYQLKERIGA